MGFIWGILKVAFLPAECYEMLISSHQTTWSTGLFDLLFQGVYSWVSQIEIISGYSS